MIEARPRQSQTMRAFAPSDVFSLLNVPDMEAKYRLIRNEWLTMASRLKQAEERVFQAERSKRKWDIEDARADLAKLQTKLGVLRRLALLARMRAEAQVFEEIAKTVLPQEVRAAISMMVEDVLQRPPGGEIKRASTAATPDVEDYRALDDLLRRWGPLSDAEPSSSPPQSQAPGA